MYKSERLISPNFELIARYAQSRGAKTGHLAYLSDSNIWIQCVAVLDPPLLTLTPSSTSNPETIIVTRLIDLSTSRVASRISSSQVDPSVPASFVITSGSVTLDKVEGHLFEIQLDGGTKELFAAASASERAAWTSAVWYDF